MLWVCRTGKRSVLIDYYLMTSRMYLPWDGFKCDLSDLKKMEDFKNIVSKEKNVDNPTSLSNWGSQLCYFCLQVNIGDLVLLPHIGSRYYTLAQVTGEYEYDLTNRKGLWHSRKIKVLKREVPRELFSQKIQYSLGAYRTIFHAKYEDEILEVFNKWNG